MNRPRAINIGHLVPDRPRQRTFQDPILSQLVALAGGEITPTVVGTYSQLTRMNSQGVDITDALINYLFAAFDETNTGRQAILRDGWVELANRLRAKPTAKAPNTSWVYFIRWGDRIKIGTSVDPKARARSLSLTEDAILLVIPGNRTTERELHRTFCHVRIDATEWFHATPDLLLSIEDLRTIDHD